MLYSYNIGKVAVVVMGEAEGQTFEEKKWIAHVVLNRLQHGNFRPIEQDFIGYKRKISVNNDLERNALIDSINASVFAFFEHFLNIDPTKGATFFATKKFMEGKDPSEVFGVDVKPVPTPSYFAHQFYKLANSPYR